jgi:hypothetical protein
MTLFQAFYKALAYVLCMFLAVGATVAVLTSIAYAVMHWGIWVFFVIAGLLWVAVLTWWNYTVGNVKK